MEKPKEYSPEEIARIEETRAVSDTEAVRSGADIRPRGSIEFTEDQKEDAQFIYDRMILRIKEELEKLNKHFEIGERNKRIDEFIERAKKLGPKSISREELYDLMETAENRAMNRLKELAQEIERIRMGNFDLEIKPRYSWLGTKK